MVTMVAASREAGKTWNASTAAYATMHNTTVDPPTAGHCWWIFLHVNLAMVLVAVFHLCGDLDMKRKHLDDGRGLRREYTDHERPQVLSADMRAAGT